MLEDGVTLLDSSRSVDVRFDLGVEHEGSMGAAVGGDSGDEVLDGRGGHAWRVGVDEWVGVEGKEREGGREIVVVGREREVGNGWGFERRFIK